jgi:hypothetical protein
MIKLPFIETVFHILNRNLPQRTEVWPPGSCDINPFDYLKCGVPYLGEVLTDPLTKRTVPDHRHHGGLQQHSQGEPQEGLQPLRSRLKEVITAKGYFIH